jgi:hypothetical protein
VIESGADGDTVKVNGSTTADDVFTVDPNGARLDFDRLSPGLSASTSALRKH